jgi:hypothetical protein
MCAGIEKTNRTDSFVAGVGEPKTGSGDIRERWRRPGFGAWRCMHSGTSTADGIGRQGGAAFFVVIGGGLT